ncbi:GNAT family N-acetyltransferase [Sphingomonas sp. PB4P5]|uniref:GNAT family N-acetyltransferase n=1 Tax=Parasphingomonas puruogangriensis TaxID=3096155 RepID=UPI002FC98F71
MTPSGPKRISPIKLIDGSLRKPVDAELWSPITETNLADWEAVWQPELQKQINLLRQAGVHRQLWPQSRKWDWRAKQAALTQRLGSASFAIVHAGMTQAMMILDYARRAKAAGEEGRHLAYVDFLEAAPWNRKTLTGGTPRFAGSGTILIGTAVQCSIQQGFKGRIGLHSLPQSNDFYANVCGMVDLGADPNYERLRYFEMTPEIATRFLKIGKRHGS